MSSKQNEKTWQNYAFKIALNTASHPIEYAKVLIQVGYEPLPPQPGTTFFGKPALKLPNIFQYIKYIKGEDGFIGCYRGLVPKLFGNIASAMACHKILEKFDSVEEDDEFDASSESRRSVRSNNSGPSEHEKFVTNMQRDVITRLTAIIVSHPFHVVTVRMMAQFVGREVKYNGMFSSIIEVYKENGLAGFFSGLVPRVLGDILSIILANTLAFALSAYVFDDAELKMYSSATMSFFASAITYPFQVVSNCMAINNAGLIAGSPPYMPVYTTWLDCWKNLSTKNQLKRGSSLLIRYYTGPQMVIGGRAVPVSKNMLKINDRK